MPAACGRHGAAAGRVVGALTGATWFSSAPSGAWADDREPQGASLSLFSGPFSEIALLVLAALALLAVVLGAVWWRLRSSAVPNRRDVPPTALTDLDVAPVPAQADEMSPPAPRRSPAARPELDEIDLVQQAEFLSLLGERDAAVALLDAQIDGAAGAQAPVWIKLMQIHRRFGDRLSFEALRPRYRQRFGTEAPPWAIDRPAGDADDPRVAAAMESPLPREADRPATRPPAG